MSKLLKRLMKNNLIMDTINVILGIALIVFVFLLALFPNNQYILLIAITIGGLMNISNGVKMIKQKKKSNMGMTFLMMGVMLIILGVFITYYVKR